MALEVVCTGGGVYWRWCALEVVCMGRGGGTLNVKPGWKGTFYAPATQSHLGKACLQRHIKCSSDQELRGQRSRWSTHSFRSVMTDPSPHPWVQTHRTDSTCGHIYNPNVQEADHKAKQPLITAGCQMVAKAGLWWHVADGDSCAGSRKYLIPLTFYVTQSLF